MIHTILANIDLLKIYQKTNYNSNVASNSDVMRIPKYSLHTPGNMDPQQAAADSHGYNVSLHILYSSRDTVLVGRPIPCVPGYVETINTHTVGFLTIPRASIKWV